MAKADELGIKIKWGKNFKGLADYPHFELTEDKQILRLINQAQNDMVCDMNINALSKYVIIFLFTVLVVLSVLLSIYAAQNKQLMQENTRLTEMVELRDAAITEIDKNIADLIAYIKSLEASIKCFEKTDNR